MAWPKDESAWEDVQKYMHCAYLAMIEQFPEIANDPIISSLLTLQRNSFGGWNALREGRPFSELQTQLPERIVRGEWVGGTLCMAYLLHMQNNPKLKDDISLRKVRRLLFRKGDCLFKKPPGERALSDAWEEFKNVAHLWAGQFFVDHWMAREIATAAMAEIPQDHPLYSREWATNFALLTCWHQAVLTVAKSIQEFGLTYKPPHSKNTLLDPTHLWTLVDIPLCPIEIPIIPISDEMIEIYQDY